MKHINTLRQRGFTQIELAVLLGITGLFGVQIIPAINDAREAARRTQCKDNLHNVGLAMHNYADTYNERFPNGWVQYTTAADEGLSHGWVARALPFFDEAELYLRVFDRGPSDPNKPSDLFQTTLEVFRCPSDDSEDLNPARDGWATSNYVGNYGSKPPPRWNLTPSEGFWPGEADTRMETDGLFMCNACIRLGQITDGTSNTFMVGERSSSGHAAIWMGVRGNRFESDVVAPCSWDAPLNQSTHGFSSQHPGGAQFVMADGAVRMISNEMSQLTYERLACRNDGQRIDFSEF